MQSQISTTNQTFKKRLVAGSSTRESSKRKNNDSSSELPDIKISKSVSDKNSRENKPYTSPELTLKGNFCICRYKRLNLNIIQIYSELEFLDKKT